MCLPDRTLAFLCHRAFVARYVVPHVCKSLRIHMLLCGCQVKDIARRNGVMDSRLAPLVSFASGAMAGAAATAASYPFDLLRTTLAAQGEPRVCSVLSLASSASSSNCPAGDTLDDSIYVRAFVAS